jgi:Zn ribbon nucleic-acid-binding protein
VDPAWQASEPFAMQSYPEPKECLKCGYHGPRLESFSRSAVHSNAFLRFVLMTFMVIPGVRTMVHFAFLGGRDACPNCGASGDFAFWRGPVSEEELALWSTKQEAENRVKRVQDKELLKVAVIWLSVFVFLTVMHLLKSM